MQRRKLATYNHASSVWETDDQCMGGHSEPYSATWPSSGMTVGGTAFELPTWAGRTGVSACSWWPIPLEGLLWTPVTTPARPQRGRDPEKWPASLDQQVTEDLPSSPGYRPDLAATSYRSADPDDAEAGLLPTPAVNDMGDGKTLGEWDAWNAGPTMRHQMHGQPLSIVAQDLDRSGSPSESLRRPPLMPTPLTSDAHPGPVDPGHREASGVGAQLLQDVTRQLAEPELLPTHMRNDPAYRSPESATRRAASGFTDLTSALAAEVGEPGLIPTPRAQVREVRDRGDGYRHNLEEWPAEMARGSSAPTSDQTGGASTAEPSLMSLLPTPTSSEAHGPGGYGPGHTGGENLATKAAGLLPTPDAYQGSRGGSQDPEKRRAGNHSVSLADVTEQGDLLPTPTVGNASRRGNWKGGKDRSDELLLPGVARAASRGGLLSTPKASNNENVCSESYTNLGTDLREVDPDLRLLGDGTSPRSDGGSES